MYPAPAYFDALAARIDAAGGTPIVMVDLDRMEANVDAIVAGIAPKRDRIVEKSLPSIDLLRLVSARAGTERLLVHLPLLTTLLDAFPGAWRRSFSGRSTSARASRRTP